MERTGTRMMARQVLCIRAQILLGLLPGITIFAIGILLAVDERLLLLNYGEHHSREGYGALFSIDGRYTSPTRAPSHLLGGGPGPVKAGGLGPQSVRHNTLEGQCPGPGPAPKSGPGPLRGDSWGKEKLEEKMGMDATAARGKGVLWCPWQAANSIARGKSPLCSPRREAYQRSHTRSRRGSWEPQLL